MMEDFHVYSYPNQLIIYPKTTCQPHAMLEKVIPYVKEKIKVKPECELSMDTFTIYEYKRNGSPPLMGASERYYESDVEEMDDYLASLKNVWDYEFMDSDNKEILGVYCITFNFEYFSVGWTSEEEEYVSDAD